MSALDKTPVNKNFLSPLNFQFQLKRAPYLNFFIQSITLPAISITFAEIPSPTLAIPYSLGHLNYDNLEITFKIDEDFQNYMEIHDWLRSLGQLDTALGYKTLQNNSKTTGDTLRSDITLIINDALKNPNYEVTFVDCFPLALGQASFQTTDDTVNYVTASAVFKYAYFNIVKL